MFEGLGLGTRLAYLPLPQRLNYVAFLGAFLYAIMTPLGVSIGLGVRTTYDALSETAQIVSGVLDSLSAGILLWVFTLCPFGHTTKVLCACKIHRSCRAARP
jgi:solute carrier family 39 (zinc transporter), member 1/2/3